MSKLNPQANPKTKNDKFWQFRNLTVLNDTVMSSSLYYKAFNLFNPFL